jgi:hypothetical protein
VRVWRTKRPVLHYSILFSVCYFNCTNFTRVCLDFLLLITKNSVKVLNNPEKVFARILPTSNRAVSLNIYRNIIVMQSLSTLTASIYVCVSYSENH